MTSENGVSFVGKTRSAFVTTWRYLQKLLVNSKAVFSLAKIIYGRVTRW